MFLDQKTGAQRLVLALGAIAGALLAIAALVVAVVRWTGDDAGRKVSSNVDGATISSGTPAADEFVRYLLSVAGVSPVDLDVKVAGQFGEGGHVPLFYACDGSGVIGKGPCSRVRLEQPSDIPISINPSGWWFQGCYQVTRRNGAGFGSEPLDIAFQRVNDRC